MHKLGEKCDLIQEGGRITDPTIDKRMDFHFNAILDVVSEWRKDKTQHQDVPLGGKWEMYLKVKMLAVLITIRIQSFVLNCLLHWPFLKVRGCTSDLKYSSDNVTLRRTKRN